MVVRNGRVSVVRAYVFTNNKTQTDTNCCNNGHKQNSARISML